MKRLLQSERVNRVVHLPTSGRKVSYAEWGIDPSETSEKTIVALLLQGADAHRFHGYFFHKIARQRNVRLIVVDRPGRGSSDPLPKDLECQRVRIVASDMLELLSEALRVEKFSIVAQCFGCVYATEVFLKDPSKVSSLFFVSPWISTAHPEMGRFLRFARKLPPCIIRGFLTTFGISMRSIITSSCGAAILRWSTSADEGAVVASKPSMLLMKQIRKQPGENFSGPKDESVAALEQLSPFGLEYSDLLTMSSKVIVYHGRKDTLVPLVAVHKCFGVDNVQIVEDGTHMLIFSSKIVEAAMVAAAC